MSYCLQRSHHQHRGPEHSSCSGIPGALAKLLPIHTALWLYQASQRKGKQPTPYHGMISASPLAQTMNRCSIVADGPTPLARSPRIADGFRVFVASVAVGSYTTHTLGETRKSKNRQFILFARGRPTCWLQPSRRTGGREVRRSRDLPPCFAHPVQPMSHIHPLGLRKETTPRPHRRTS